MRRALVPEHVHINVYDPHRPGTVVVVGVFQIDTGSAAGISRIAQRA